MPRPKRMSRLESLRELNDELEDERDYRGELVWHVALPLLGGVLVVILGLYSGSPQLVGGSIMLTVCYLACTARQFVCQHHRVQHLNELVYEVLAPPRDPSPDEPV